MYLLSFAASMRLRRIYIALHLEGGEVPSELVIWSEDSHTFTTPHTVCHMAKGLIDSSGSPHGPQSYRFWFNVWHGLGSYGVYTPTV